MTSTWPRVIAHADLDAFYASVEQLDDPALRGKPLLVGPRTGRGVVLTASYEARPFRVGSAMPMAEALRRCPQALVVPPRFERYTELSRRVMAVFRDFTPEVEAISLDEAFLNMTGTEHLFGPPEAMALQLKQAVFEATGGLTISVGVSGTKYVAKVASGYRKPDAVTVVPPAEARAWLAPQSVARLWGAGPKTQARLEAAGYATIGDVAAADPETLRAQLGELGLRFAALARGEDARRVAPIRRVKSISSERTLREDLTDPAELRAHLTRAADRLGTRLRAKGWLAQGLRVKLKSSEFQTFTRQMPIEPTDAAVELRRGACVLLDQFDHPGPFRLVGLGAFDLVRAEQVGQLALFAEVSNEGSHTPAQERRLEGVIDALQSRFGAGAIRRARDLSDDTVLREGVNLDFETGMDDD
ncbi:MAG: DNA polymerase IV [Pseudomonadota bacterium]